MRRSTESYKGNGVCGRYSRLLVVWMPFHSFSFMFHCENVPKCPTSRPTK